MESSSGIFLLQYFLKMVGMLNHSSHHFHPHQFCLTHQILLSSLSQSEICRGEVSSCACDLNE